MNNKLRNTENQQKVPPQQQELKPFFIMKSIVILTNDDLPAKEGLSQFFAGKIIFNCRLAGKCSVADDAGSH